MATPEKHMPSKKNPRVVELERLIKRHQDLYYNGQPELSDADFDALWDELKSLDPANAILSRVGADALDGWPKARHLIPMGSQEKASNPEDFLAWCAKVRHPEYLVQYKLDGASLELQYEGGRLVRAVTRGDGETGDEITPNVLKMRGVRAVLPEAFSGGVRGEVLMPHAVHEAKYADKANCRNAANGLMKRKDGSGSEDLLVICYDAAGTSPAGAQRGLFEDASPAESPFSDELEKLEWLKRMGFETVPLSRCKSPEEVVEFRARVMEERPGLPYDIDGLVVKAKAIDGEDMRRARPEKQIAFKFSLEEAVTTLRSVEWSESGASYTPIGLVDPVRLAGTTVQRANLCNTNIIRGLGLKIGSRVVITKRGEIIPKIESLVESPAGAVEIEVPWRCSCGATLVDEGTRLYCPNPDCPKKLRHRVEKWLQVLDVKDFGGVIVGKLLDSGRVKSIPDLYTLTPGELSGYERMGDTLAAKILRNLAARRELSLPEFIAGFDIEGIGELIAEKAVAAGFDSLEKLRAASPEALAAVFGLGDITAATILEGLKALGPEMDALLASGAVQIKGRASGGALSGKSFCFTGELSSMKRAEAEAAVKALGGTAKSSVTKGLSYLVTNDPGSGSDKNRKAETYGVSVIDEAAFLGLIGRA
jgi:DNA ligase (NAD+)